MKLNCDFQRVLGMVLFLTVAMAYVLNVANRQMSKFLLAKSL